jgi:hypothetical protein
MKPTPIRVYSLCPNCLECPTVEVYDDGKETIGEAPNLVTHATSGTSLRRRSRRARSAHWRRQMNVPSWGGALEFVRGAPGLDALLLPGVLTALGVGGAVASAVTAVPAS